LQRQGRNRPLSLFNIGVVDLPLSESATVKLEKIPKIKTNFCGAPLSGY
jgi:hypothetical protein